MSSSSISFSRTQTIDFSFNEFRVEFNGELKRSAAKCGAAYKTEAQQKAYDERVWVYTCDEVGDEYDMNDELNDDDDLDESAAGYAIRSYVAKAMASVEAEVEAVNAAAKADDSKAIDAACAKAHSSAEIMKLYAAQRAEIILQMAVLQRVLKTHEAKQTEMLEQIKNVGQ
jgi:hypothetical protein